MSKCNKLLLWLATGHLFVVYIYTLKYGLLVLIPSKHSAVQLCPCYFVRSSVKNLGISCS